MSNRFLNGEIYDAAILGGNLIGEIINGKIYKIEGISKRYVGRIDTKGYIYDDQWLGGECIGRVDEDGNVYRGTWMGGEQVGHIDQKGRAFGGWWLGGEYVGRIKFKSPSQNVVRNPASPYDEGSAKNNGYGNYTPPVPPIPSDVAGILSLAIIIGLVLLYGAMGFSLIMGIYTTIMVIIIVTVNLSYLFESGNGKKYPKTAMIILVAILVGGDIFFHLDRLGRVDDIIDPILIQCIDWYYNTIYPATGISFPLGLPVLLGLIPIILFCFFFIVWKKKRGTFLKCIILSVLGVIIVDVYIYITTTPEGLIEFDEEAINFLVNEVNQ